MTHLDLHTAALFLLINIGGAAAEELSTIRDAFVPKIYFASWGPENVWGVLLREVFIRQYILVSAPRTRYAGVCPAARARMRPAT